MSIIKNFIFTIYYIIVIVGTAHWENSSRARCIRIFNSFLLTGWWSIFSIILRWQHLLKGLVFVKTLCGLLVTTKHTFWKLSFFSTTLISCILSICLWWKKLLDVVIQFFLIFISGMAHLLLLLLFHLHLMIPFDHLLDSFPLLLF